MLVFGTQMHLVTFIFVSIELVILFYLGIHKLARPDDKAANLNIILISLLLIYNITGGLLPDPKLLGSFFLQEVIAYATGFITPSYFPYYVYHTFGLKQLKFHAYRGVFLFLVLPYLIFVIIFATTDDIRIAQNLLILPVLYAIWVIATLIAAINKKYHEHRNSKESKSEMAVLLLSIAPWIGLPVVTYFDMGQPVEALITNMGFLLLFALQTKRDIKLVRTEHERLLESEKMLQNWNTDLREQVRLRTEQLEKLNEQRVNNFINLVHEIKTPLTLVKNYIDEYFSHHDNSRELHIIKAGVDKLVADVVNLFDLDRFIKGIGVYNHNQVSDFSGLLKQAIIFFEHYSVKKHITCKKNIEEDIFIKADPNAINRIINNIIENAVKYSMQGGKVKIILTGTQDKISFIVEDDGVGIDIERQKKLFEPYFQISHKTTALQGMGLGLTIVKKILDKLKGSISIQSNPTLSKGTKVSILLDRHFIQKADVPHREAVKLNSTMYDLFDYNLDEEPYDPHNKSILLIEDSKAMLHFLYVNLVEQYNVFYAFNGADALKKIDTLPATPHLILLDIMMDKMDGFHFAKIISDRIKYNHIPIIFLTAKSTRDSKLKGLQLGAIDYISKPFAFELLKHKIENILNQMDRNYQAIINNSILHHNDDRNAKTIPKEATLINVDKKCKLHGLTNRETEIAKSLRIGKSYKAIAEGLFISERTVTKHIQNIFEKTGVSNKIELINTLHI